MPMATDMSSLIVLLNWMSPTFPIGSFAYSHGLEQAIADGRVRSADDARIWIANLLQHGSGWNDAVLLAACWNKNADDVNDLALALAGSAERYRETTELGRNFNIAASAWADKPKYDGMMAYPVAAAMACRQMGIARDQALLAFLQGFASALVSVAVRLVPLGQTKGLELLRDLSHLITATVHRATHASLDDVGGSCIAADIASMQHETLEPRIFRT
jgi:urease accessory protein